MTTNYGQVRQALGLTEEQAVSLVTAAAYAQGAQDAADRIARGVECGSVADAIAKHVPLALPNAADLLLADAPVEEGKADA